MSGMINKSVIALINLGEITRFRYCGRTTI